METPPTEPALPERTIAMEPPAPPQATEATETIVVPAGPVVSETNLESTENPFIPKDISTGADQSNNNTDSPGSVQNKPKVNNLPRRLLMIGILAIFLIVVLLIGKFILGFVTGANKEVVLTYWGLWENESIVRSVIGDYQSKHTKIKIEYIKQSPKQYRERLQAAISRGEGPDIFRFHNTWVAMLKNDLTPVPKTVMTPIDFSSTFYPVATSDLVAGQTIYGIPLMIDGLGLYFNEDIFAQKGITPPATWEDLMAIVPKITDKNENAINISAIALGSAGNVENFSDILATMFLQNGVDLTSPVGKLAEETLIFYRKFATPSDPLYTWNETLDNSIYAFATGKVAMILAPSWRVFDIKQFNPNLHFKIAPVPQLPGNTINWASYWVEGVSTKSKYQREAWEFLKYLTSKEVMTKLYTESAKSRLFGEPYSRVDLASSLENDPYVGAYIRQAKTAKSFPLASRTSDNGINDKLIKYLEDAVNGLSSGAAPSSVLQTASSGFRQVLETYSLTSSNVQSGR